MRLKKLLFTLLAMFAVCSAQAQSEVDVTIRNQSTNGDTLFFDIYLQLVSGDPVYLENSDFVFSYDTANFTTPEFGFVDGSTYLLNSNGARTTAYNYNIYTRFGEAFNAGDLMVLVQLPAFSNQTEFDDRIAKIDTQDGTHRLGTFYITGMENMSINPDITWKTTGDGADVQIFGLDDNSPWNGGSADVDAIDPDPEAEPTTNSSNITFSNVSGHSLTLTIGNTGNGARRLILARALTSISPYHPADGIMYTADAEFGEGSQIGTSGVFAVYNGIGNSVTVTGLYSGIPYYFEVYEYNGDNGATENYKIPGAEVSEATPVVEPEVNSTTLTFSNVTSTSMTVNIGTNGDGYQRLILARASSSIGSNHPSDQTTYTADSAFGSGSQIGSSGVYTVYSGTGGSQVTVTGLSAGTTYYFEAYEFNGLSGAEDYLTPGTEVSQATDAGTIAVNVKVLLQGPNSSGTMNTLLNSKGYLPLNQPYSASPWSYSGQESVANGFFTTNSTIVDWVLVELRETASGSAVERKACFIKNNGSLVDTSGSGSPQFTVSAGNYYVVIRHRNHLPVMTSSAIPLNSNSTEYNFTTGSSQAYGTNPMKLVGSFYTMWAGDVTGNGQIKYNGSANDRLPMFNKVGNTIIGTFNGYTKEDVNMNGQVKYNGAGNDRLIIFNNVGNSLIGTVSKQVP